MSQRIQKIFRGIPPVVYVFGLMFVTAMILYENFFTFLNVSNVLRQSSILGILSIGMTMVIIAGSIDLSIGMMLGFSGAIAVKFAGSLPTAISITLAICAVIGLVNGIFIAKLKYAPMIMTISMSFLLRGLIFLINGPSAVSISDSAASFKAVGQGYMFGGIAVPIVIYLAITAVLAFVLKNTAFGRHIYATGGNPDSASLAGVNCDWVLIRAHVCCSILAGFAGILLTSRLGAITPLQGEGFETRGITAAVIGGTLLLGGVGNVWGTLMGALIMSLITNIFNMQGNIMSGWQYVANGTLMMLVVLLQSDVLRQMIKRAAKALCKTGGSL